VTGNCGNILQILTTTINEHKVTQNKTNDVLYLARISNVTVTRTNQNKVCLLVAINDFIQ